MTKLKSSTGKFNSTVTEIMTDVRKPVFVDNAVHHALITSQSNNKQKVIIENRNNATYKVFSEKQYEIVEGQSSIELTHVRRPGHTSINSPFYEDGVLSPTSTKPTLMYSAKDPSRRLSLSSIEVSDKGIKINIPNMKGRQLNDIRFQDKSVHLGDPIDIGLRTSDLAMRLGTDASSTLTSVSLGGLRGPANTNSARRKHTTKFLAEDFYGVTLISALKFTSRHDSNIIHFDRFANMIYSPFTFTTSTRFLDSSDRFGNEETNPSSHSENRIAIRGVPIALNASASATVDDAERQQGKSDTDIQETITPIFDATVKSVAAAKRVARQILKANSIQSGSLKSSGYPDVWDLRPGDIVSYDGVKKMITESRHTLSNRLSDLNFISVQKGIDGVLRGVSEGMVAASSGDNPDQISQKEEANLSLFSSIEISILPIITIRGVERLNSKFAIGKAAGRGAIGGASGQKAIGASKFGEMSMRGGE